MSSVNAKATERRGMPTGCECSLNVDDVEHGKLVRLDALEDWRPEALVEFAIVIECARQTILL